MNHQNVIDMSAYFLSIQEPQGEKASKSDSVKRAVYHAASILEAAATVGISLGFCVCTFLCFTIL